MNEQMVKAFHLRIQQGKKMTDSPDYDVTGTGDQWKKHCELRFPGFERVIVLSLESLWISCIKEKREKTSQQLVGLETIIKYNNTMQLKEVFQVEISITF